MGRVPEHLAKGVPARGPCSMLGVVLERSRQLCGQAYEKERFTETDFWDAYARCQERLGPEELAVFAGG